MNFSYNYRYVKIANQLFNLDDWLQWPTSAEKSFLLYISFFGRGVSKGKEKKFSSSMCEKVQILYHENIIIFIESIIR